ncbi:hypothetical protein EOM39_03315 [Candidatus Gracilibacteria bacterium]|nr:hypothetical protein [Candidatus Gracilibacteria bacterium]
MKKYGTTGTLFKQGKKYKWSYKYEHCVECGTCKFKHKGNGLCTSCWDKKRAIHNKNRQRTLRINKIRWYAKRMVRHYLIKTHRLKGGPKKILTEEQKKQYKKDWEKKNRYPKKLIKIVKERQKNGLYCMQIVINGTLRYLPFDNLYKPLLSRGKYCDNETYEDQMIKYKEKLYQLDILKIYYTKHE